jgi:hypothetical protein
VASNPAGRSVGAIAAHDGIKRTIPAPTSAARLSDCWLSSGLPLVNCPSKNPIAIPAAWAEGAIPRTSSDTARMSAARAMKVRLNVVMAYPLSEVAPPARIDGAVTDPELEALLAAVRPEPSPRFVSDLEDSLLGSRRPTRVRWWRRPSLIAATGVAGLAGVVLAVSLAGLSPFTGDPALKATPSCTTELVATVVEAPVIVTDPDGTDRIGHRRQPGTRPVTVCVTAHGRTTTP